MSIRRLLLLSSLLLVVSVVLPPTQPIAAQDPIRLTEQAFSGNNEFTVAYPFGWEAGPYDGGVTLRHPELEAAIYIEINSHRYDGVSPADFAADPTQDGDALRTQALLAPLGPNNRATCANGEFASNKQESFSPTSTVVWGDTTFATLDYRCEDTVDTVLDRMSVGFITDAYALYATARTLDLSEDDIAEIHTIQDAMMATIQVNALLLAAEWYRFDRDFDAGNRDVDPIYGETNAQRIENFGFVNYVYPFGWDVSVVSTDDLRINYSRGDGSDSLTIVNALSSIDAAADTTAPDAEAHRLAFDGRIGRVLDAVQPINEVTQLSGPNTFEVGDNLYTEFYWHQRDLLRFDNGEPLANTDLIRGFGVLTTPNNRHYSVRFTSTGLTTNDLDMARFHLIHAQHRSFLGTFSIETFPDFTPNDYVPLTRDTLGDTELVTALPDTQDLTPIQFLDDYRLLATGRNGYIVYNVLTGERVGFTASGRLYVINPDQGLFVATDAESVILTLIDLQNGGRIYQRSFRTERSDNDPDTRLQIGNGALSPDGTILAQALFTDPYTIEFIDVATGDRLERISTPFAAGLSESNFVLTDSAIYACLYNTERGWIEFYSFSIATGNVTAQWLTDAGQCSEMLMTPDNTSIIVSGQWALAGELFGRFTTGNFGVAWSNVRQRYTNLAYGFDGNTLVGYSNRSSFSAIDVATGDILSGFSQPDIAGAYLSPSNQFVLATGNSGPFRIYAVLPAAEE